MPKAAMRLNNPSNNQIVPGAPSRDMLFIPLPRVIQSANITQHATKIGNISSGVSFLVTNKRTANGIEQTKSIGARWITTASQYRRSSLRGGSADGALLSSSARGAVASGTSTDELSGCFLALRA